MQETSVAIVVHIGMLSQNLNLFTINLVLKNSSEMRNAILKFQFTQIKRNFELLQV